MKLFKKLKDGGPDSLVTGFFLCEIKPLFSIVLLHFSSGTREAYHSHAFDACSWILKGQLHEQHLNGNSNFLVPSILPVFTYKDTFHKVLSIGDTWALSFRGPWKNTWREFLPNQNKFKTLTHGRKEI